MLSRQNALGKLSLSSSLVTSKAKTIDKLTHKEKLNMKTKSDKSQCFISGCVVLPSSKLVLADFFNSKLKVVDTESKAVMEEKTLDSAPWDIAALPQDKIAITMSKKKQVLIMSTAGKLSIVRRIPVKGECRGLTYYQGQLYVICWDPHSVVIVDTQGQVIETVSNEKDKFSSPNYILVSNDQRSIYISDCGRQCVTRVILHGDTSAEYTNSDLQFPTGMMVLDDGSLMVCCSVTIGKGSIYRISSDFKQGKPIVDDLGGSQSLCYNRHEQKVYIGCASDELIVFSVK